MSASRSKAIQSYLLGLSPKDCEKLIGWMLVELSHTPAMAELIDGFKAQQEQTQTLTDEA